jgi:hypothetical protein
LIDGERRDKHPGRTDPWTSRGDGARHRGQPVPGRAMALAFPEVAELRDNREKAMEHLDHAGELFAQCGAKLYLDQVLAKIEIHARSIFRQPSTTSRSHRQ